MLCLCMHQLFLLYILLFCIQHIQTLNKILRTNEFLAFVTKLSIPINLHNNGLLLCIAQVANPLTAHNTAIFWFCLQNTCQDELTRSILCLRSTTIILKCSLYKLILLFLLTKLQFSNTSDETHSVIHLPHIPKIQTCYSNDNPEITSQSQISALKSSFYFNCYITGFWHQSRPWHTLNSSRFSLSIPFSLQRCITSGTISLCWFF